MLSFITSIEHCYTNLGFVANNKQFNKQRLVVIKKDKKLSDNFFVTSQDSDNLQVNSCIIFSLS